MASGFQSNKGLRRMMDQLQDMADLPNEQMQDDLERAMTQAATTASGHTHVLSGALRGSVKFSSESTPEGWEGEISWDTYYGPYEFARDGHDPREHLKPHEEDIHNIAEQGPKYI